MLRVLDDYYHWTLSRSVGLRDRTLDHSIFFGYVRVFGIMEGEGVGDVPVFAYL
jgi:hypothetical protein